MSLQFNSDRQRLVGTNPQLVGTDDLTIRSGAGASEREIFRAQLDPNTNLPRIGINRTGKRVESITITAGGAGYTGIPSVQLSAPDESNGRQALASALVDNQQVVGITVDDSGDGYTSPPSVTITGGSGAGAAATAALDTVDFELDVNGAIRTSTSIISDTARILNLDITNLITPDVNIRAANLKTYANNTGTAWVPNVRIVHDVGNPYRVTNTDVYQALNTGTTDPVNEPTHKDGIELNGEVLFKHVGFRSSNPSLPFYDQTGDSGIFPRSITPLQGDRSDKIATTEYVLGLATNDVGGRVYVSEQIGDDANDGRSAVAPVRSIKRACQIAQATVGVKETVIIAGGEYIEDNPISIPPDCSIVGDNLRLVIVRPQNPGKHMFKLSDKNYIFGITFRDYVDSFGDPEHTWDYAVVFDDKQRVYYDPSYGGDFGRDFEIGHQIFGPQEVRVTFQSHGGTTNLVSGLEVSGVNSTATGIITNVSFETTTGPTAYQNGFIDIRVTDGVFNTGETFEYFIPDGGTDGQGNPTGTTYSLVGSNITSIRAEGEVVSENKDLVSFLPISRVDGSLQGDPSIATGGFQSDIFGNAEDLGGIVLYTNPLSGRDNVHDFKEGQIVELEGFTGSLEVLNGKQRIYKILRDADGRSRRFVIPKKIPAFTSSNFEPTDVTVKSYSYSVTLTLLNSPNKFTLPEPVSRRYQDACTLIRNNVDFIADEVVKQINDEFAKKYFTVNNVDGVNNTFDIYTPPNEFAHTYVSGGTVTFGGVDYTVADLSYNNVTGIGTITTTSTVASLANGDVVKVEGIVVSCSQGQKIYPGFNIPGGDEKCYRDVKHYLNSIIRDLEFGGNYNVIESAERYVQGTQIGYIGTQISESVRAYELARQLAKYAVCNWRTGDGTTADPLYTPKYSSLSRYIDDTVITTTAGVPACNDVKNSLDTLAYLFVDIITNNATGTYLDAGYLIGRNLDLIIDESLQYTKDQYPSLGLTLVEEYEWKQDLKNYLRAIRRDLILGGNTGTVTEAESYFELTTLVGIPAEDLAEKIVAFNKARDLAIQAMRNWSDGTVSTATPTNATYDSTSGALTVTIPDPTTPLTTSHRIAFKEGALTFNCTSNGGGDLASPTPTDRNYGKSLTITNVTSSGGSTTITTNVGDAGTAAGVAHTFVSALANGTILIYDPVIPQFSTVPVTEDWNILLYGSTPLCANVESSITTLAALFEDILDGTIVAGDTTKTTGTLYDIDPTFPEGTIYDSDNRAITPIGIWDDLPTIEASPYIQNSSIISFLGGNGVEVDGAKVTQPNSPFPGLEQPIQPGDDPKASFPNQGKSMVASAFTIVSQGGTGYRVINDGYTQLVSVFVIFCQDGILCESGGYASVTNSATNFGTYALRAVGYREEEYEFDVGTIQGVSQTTGTGRTILEVSGLGREPLEHYIVKIDGYENADTNIEYFVEGVDSDSVNAPFNADLELNAVAQFRRLSDNQVVSPSIGEFLGKTVRLHRPSIVNSSSHTWEFAGAGTDYNALPENGGTKIEANEQVSENYGRVYTSGTDELGDFKVGYFAKIENRTGAITFTGSVTISEVEFLKLKGGDVVVTGFSNDNTLGGSFSTDSFLPTQKAVKDYIGNNLGQYINKPYSTNPVPRALVELTDSGKISIDQIPALRPFEVYTVANQTERLALEGALAGDIAIQADTSQSFILNNDNSSLFFAFPVDNTLQFATNAILTGSLSGGQLQVTEYRQGVVYQINITNPGAGYTSAPTVTISGGNPALGAVSADAVATIASGQVVAITIILYNGYVGGKGYTTQPTVNIGNPPAGGTPATASALIESRVYGNIVNNIKITDTDTVQSTNSPTETVNISRVLNTSSSINTNWVSLSSNQIAASDVTSGVFSISRLTSDTGAANSFTFYRGDQSFAPAVQSIRGSENRYFAKVKTTATLGSSAIVFESDSNMLLGHTVVSNVTGIAADTNITGVLTANGETVINLNNPLTADITAGTILEFTRPTSALVLGSTYSQGGFVASIVIQNGGTGFTNGNYFDVPLQGGSGTGLRANFTVANNSITNVVVTNGGTGYSSGGDFAITTVPTELSGGSNMNLLAKLSTNSKQYADVTLDIFRADDKTISADPYGNAGIARFRKEQFDIGVEGNGSITLKTGSGSNLDADLLDGAEGLYYLNGGNFLDGTIVPAKLASGTYTIAISGQSGSTLRLVTTTGNPTSNPLPSAVSSGVTADTRNNTADTLDDGGTKHLVLTLRNGGSAGDTSFGGVRQLAFTDNDNMWLRGSSTGVSNFGSWAKIWSSLNDGSGSELDADRLDGRQGSWYQNALNINFGTLNERRLPVYQSAKDIKDTIRVLGTVNKVRYDIYVSGQTLTTAPFIAGRTVNLYNQNGQGTGTVLISNVTIFNDTNDDTNDYTIITGVLETGTFTGAVEIGTIADGKVAFTDFSINGGGTYEAVKLYSDSGTARLRMGRVDGVATSPSIYFNTSATAATTYNSAIIASGGTAADGSGSLNFIVGSVDSASVNGNKIWNAGNVTFNTNNVVDTAVLRDAGGNFAAGTITASLTGAASLNVLKTGDTMTGSLNIQGASSDLSVGRSGTFGSNLTVTNDLTVDSGTLFVDASQNNVGIGTLSPASNVKLDVRGSIRVGTFAASQTNSGEAWFGRASDRQDGTFTLQLGGDNASGTKFELVDRAWSKVIVDISGEAPANSLNIKSDGALGLGRIATTGYRLDVNGALLVQDSITIDTDNDNSGAPLTFRGSSSYRNFRIGNQLVGNHLFTVQASTNNGGTTWNSTPAITVNGSNNRVGINSSNPQYTLDVNGDVNFTGTITQNGNTLTSSNWTESTTGGNIYRLSKVGINVADPTYTLQVGGTNNNGLNIEGTNFTAQGQNSSVLYANGDPQWVDTYGVIKTNRNTISENVTIPANTNAISGGQITIVDGFSVTIENGSEWTVV